MKLSVKTLEIQFTRNNNALCVLETRLERPLFSEGSPRLREATRGEKSRGRGRLLSAPIVRQPSHCSPREWIYRSETPSAQKRIISSLPCPFSHAPVAGQ